MMVLSLRTLVKPLSHNFLPPGMPTAAMPAQYPFFVLIHGPRWPWDAFLAPIGHHHARRIAGLSAQPSTFFDFRQKTTHDVDLGRVFFCRHDRTHGQNSLTKPPWTGVVFFDVFFQPCQPGLKFFQLYTLERKRQNFSRRLPSFCWAC